MRKIILPLFFLLFLFSCQKEITTSANSTNAKPGIGNLVANTGRSSLISICHKTGSAGNPWITIEINENALSAHISHGDIIPDADGDGYTKVNPCGEGNQDDCDDADATINPGAVEVCDGIDNNCNGQIDDNCITLVTACNQVWMSKNLEVSTYRNGDEIPQVQDLTTWNNLTTGAWCYYNNDPANGAIYGKLYNWYAVNDPRGLAPQGWHIPTYSEWLALGECLGGASEAGGAMKESGTTHWLAPNVGATNSSGLTSLPGGFRNHNNYAGIGSQAAWWLANLVYPDQPHPYAGINFGSLKLMGDATNFDKWWGLSVRCVKD